MYYEKNKEKFKQYYEKNKIIIKQKRSLYLKSDIGRVKNRTRQAKRHAAKLNRTPNWLTKDNFKQIEYYYTVAKILEIWFSEKYHVDHIIPLQGENVSGLHVPWNLQVITAKENLSKRNKIILDS